MPYELAPLPLKNEFQTLAVMKQLARAHRYLGVLNGLCSSIPNESILINTLSLQEAKESSAIENIITTYDDLYKSELYESYFDNIAAKEVSRYSVALKRGFMAIRAGRPIVQSLICDIQEALVQNKAGFRRNPGTVLKNEQTGDVVYTPPQDYDQILRLMENLVEYINDSSLCPLDPLIKMALILHRFESIHPFYDGNGRTGRIINVLYLVRENLLHLPILYLSRYIIRHKESYYNLLQTTRDTDDWEAWLLFILKGIEEVSQETITLIEELKTLMQVYKNGIRTKLPKIYSQGLLNNLFSHPYTKIGFVEQELQVNRQTAASYLNKLASEGFLSKIRLGRDNFYINEPLFALFSGAGMNSAATEPSE